MKKLTVILPVYNAEPFLPETLKRVLGQTFAARYPGAMEVIAVDDASTDASLRILRETEQEHPEMFHVIALSENRGPGGARNAALDAAVGEYIGMIDADDLPDVTMYEKLWEASFFPGAREESADSLRYDIVDCEIFSQAEGTTFSYTPKKLCGHLNDAGRARLISEVGCPVTRIYRRELLERYHLRFREHVITMEDQDFLCEVFAHAGSVNVVPEVLYTYRDTAESATKRGAETNFFEGTIEAVLATYERLSVLPNYVGIREGAEFFYLYQCALAHSVVDTYCSEKVITQELAEQMVRMLRRVISATTQKRATDNKLICERFGEDEAERFARLLQKEN